MRIIGNDRAEFRMRFRCYPVTAPVVDLLRTVQWMMRHGEVRSGTVPDAIEPPDGLPDGERLAATRSQQTSRPGTR